MLYILPLPWEYLIPPSLRAARGSISVRMFTRASVMNLSSTSPCTHHHPTAHIIKKIHTT